MKDFYKILKKKIYFFLYNFEINFFLLKNYWLTNKENNNKNNNNILIFPTGNKYLLFIIALISKFICKNVNVYIFTKVLNGHEGILFKKMGFPHENILSIPDFENKKLNQYSIIAKQMIKGGKIKDLIKIKYKNIFCIRHVLSTIMRKSNLSQLKIYDQNSRASLIQEVAKSLALIDYAFKLLKIHNFKKVLISEKGYTPYAEFYNVAIELGIDLINIYPSQYADKVLIKRFNKKNIFDHYFTIDNTTWKEIKNKKNIFNKKIGKEIIDSYNKKLWLKRKRTQENKKIYKKKQLIDKLNLNPKFPNVIIFSHILFDATFWYGTNIFDDYADWIIKTVKYVNNINNVNWIIKMHPDNFWKIKNYNLKKFDEHLIIKKNIKKINQNIKFIYPDSDICPSSFFKIANAVVTVRGTVGLEYPCFGIPVITAGTGRYNNRGFTIDPKNKLEYFKTLKNIRYLNKISKKKTAIAQKFASAVFIKKPQSLDPLLYFSRSENSNFNSFYQFDIKSNKYDFYRDKSLKKIYNFIFESKKIDLI